VAAVTGSAANVVGNMALADEHMHPVDDHAQFNESALLTMFDLEAGAGGFVRIGNRPNEGHAEATFCWFLPDGSALFSFDRAPISGNERFRTAKIAVDLVEPGRTLRASFRGEAHHLASARDLIDPKAAFTGSPKAEAGLDLTLTGVSPLYGGTPFPGLKVGGHYEQHMRVEGALTIGGRALAVNALGNRDHSWGPRVWQATYADRTLWCTFGDDFGIATSLTWHSRYPDEYEVIGYAWKDGRMIRIIDASVHSEFEDPAHLFHATFTARLHLEDGQSLVLEGRALQIAPLRHRREGQTTHIGWAMAEFVCDGRKGLGLSEYLDIG
jgi:hypothetical protein